MDLNTIYCVDWIDACDASTGWESAEYVCGQKPHKCRSVGYIVDSSDTHIVMASCVSKDQLASSSVIPTGCIINKWTIAEVKSPICENVDFAQDE